MKHSFFGGVHPKDEKKRSRQQSIQPYAPPKSVVIPMSQHIGAPCQPLVKKGDHVNLGQKIGDGTGLCVPVHASVSGTVTAVEARPHSNGTTVLSVVIENDFLDTPAPEISPRAQVNRLTPEELIAIIREAGIVGMGGATFPTHVKLSSGIGKVDTILINASECEPFITADESLLFEEPHRVLRGIAILMKILGLPEATIGIENNKPHCILALRQALPQHPGIRLLELKTRYPQGSEKQLIQAVTGRQVPPGGLPAAVGCAVFNAATCAAVGDAVYDGMPLIRRVVTVSGDIVIEPQNLLVPIGVNFNDLLETAGRNGNPYKILSGGPMMGVTQFDLSVPVIKGTNAITMLGERYRYFTPQPHCIRCGKCMSVCPMHLMPLRLYAAERKNDLAALEQLNLLDCVECGSCAYTCPGCLPLVHSIRTAKQKLRDAKSK